MPQQQPQNLKQSDVLALLRDGFQRKREIKQESKSPSYQEVPNNLHVRQQNLHIHMNHPQPMYNPTTYDENHSRQLSAYMKQQKYLKHKEKIRNVQLWKKQSLEYQEEGYQVDDPALDKVEKPDSNQSIDTRELERLMKIEADYKEEEKILKQVYGQQKMVKNSDSSGQQNDVTGPLQLVNGNIDLRQIFGQPNPMMQ